MNNNYARIVHYVNKNGEPDYLFSVESMLEAVIASIVKKGATNIRVAVL